MERTFSGNLVYRFTELEAIPVDQRRMDIDKRHEDLRVGGSGNSRRTGHGNSHSLLLYLETRFRAARYGQSFPSRLHNRGYNSFVLMGFESSLQTRSCKQGVIA